MIAIVGGEGRRRRPAFFEDSVWVPPALSGGEIEAVTYFVKVLLRSTEFTGSDDATKDDDSEDKAESCDLALAQSSVELPRPLSS